MTDRARTSTAARRDRALIAVILVAVLVPFVIADIRIVLIKGGYATVGDISNIELRVRDVLTRHTPLVGPYSRYGWNHPGPALYYVLAIPYWLSGRHSSGLAIGALAVNAAACVGVVLLARRRAGIALAAAAGLVMLVFVHAFGFAAAASSWNPTLPVIPLVLFCMLAWSVAVGDSALLACMIFVGSFVAQSHIGLVFVVVAVGGYAGIAFAIRHRRGTARVTRRQAIAAIAVAAAMWFAPLLDAALHQGGNVRALFDYFTQSHAHIGMSEAWRIVAGELSTNAQWLRGYADNIFTGEPTSVLHARLPSVAALVVVAVVLMYALRRRNASRDALLLAVVALVASLFAVASIEGVAYDYLSTWVSAVAVFAVVALAAALLMSVPLAPRLLAAIATVCVVAVVVASAYDVHESLTFPDPSDAGSHLVARAAHDLTKMTILRGRTVIVDSAPDLGSAEASSGLMLRLARAGIKVGVPAGAGYVYGRQRIDTDPDAALLLGMSVVSLTTQVPHPRRGMRLLLRETEVSPARQLRYERFLTEVQKLAKQNRYAEIRRLTPVPPGGSILTIWEVTDHRLPAQGALRARS